jgi:hypothetical protein
VKNVGWNGGKGDRKAGKKTGHGAGAVPSGARLAACEDRSWRHHSNLPLLFSAGETHDPPHTDSERLIVTERNQLGLVS